MIDRKTMLTWLVGAAMGSLAAIAIRAGDAPAPKAYVIAEINVTDPEAYKAYASAVPAIIQKFGGVYLARGGRTAPIEGAPPAARVAVLQFPSFAAAQAFESSPEYRAIVPLRQRASTGRLFIAEGVAP